MPKPPFHLSLRLRSLACGAVVVALAACENPTAPQARDAIEKIDRQVLQGDLESLSGALGYLIDESRYRGHFAGVGNHRAPVQSIPSGRVTVDVDGRESDYIGAVLERIYVPFGASGARPLIRRTFMAWPADTGSGEVIMVSSEDSVATVVAPMPQWLDNNSPERLFGRAGFVVRSTGIRQVPWFGSEGAIELHAVGPDGPCPPFVIGAYGQMPTDSTVNCASGATTVSVNAVLRHGNPDNGDMLSRLRPTYLSIRIPSQSIPTVRLTTHCVPGVFAVTYCATTMAFWRDNAQFPAKLGLDLAQMRDRYPTRDDGKGGYEHGGTFWQEVEAGSGTEEMCCEFYHGPVQYRLLSPKGDVLLSGSPAIASSDSVLKRIDINVYMRVGARRLFLGVAGPIPGPLVFELTRR